MSRVVNLFGHNGSTPSTVPTPDLDGPSDAELAEIEREMPLIEAEINLVDAEIRVLCAEPHPTDLDWRHLRRAEADVARAFIALHAAGVPLNHLGRAA